jgi:hypothetical protein
LLLHKSTPQRPFITKMSHRSNLLKLQSLQKEAVVAIMLPLLQLHIQLLLVPETAAAAAAEAERPRRGMVWSACLTQEQLIRTQQTHTREGGCLNP